ncbi:hypothetical protein ACFSTE_13315 [Aquimarina hainanensis]|uniref:Uncharacterized protein n=1 Tax=Aquimarina hainanensis TaxID=1578017 RepID=A0ABW5NBK8_9FLAO
MAFNIHEAFKEIATDDRFIQDIREISVSKVFHEDTNNFFTIVPGVKGGQQVAAMKGIEYVTRKSQGCGGPSLSPKFPAISQKWNPQLVEVKIKYCYTEFMQKFTQWGLANGHKIKDLGEADFFQFIVDLVVEAMKLDAQRIVLFGDEEIAGQNILNDENKVQYYDLIKKGLIPTMQYFNTHPELMDNFITLSKNSDPNQYNLESDYSLNLYEKLVDTYEFDGDILLSSHKLYKNYENYFKRLAGVGIQSSKDEIQNGIQNLKVDGENITTIKNYDRWRNNDFKVENTVHLPHFALFTKKEHLQLGVDDASALENLHLEYIGGEDEHFYIKGNYMIDFKMTNPFEFRAAL